MTRPPLRVLILEDRPADAELIALELKRQGLPVAWSRVETPDGFLAGLDTGPDVVLADYSLPGFNALQALDLLHERRLDIPCIVVTGTIGEEAAVDCLKRGAADYLLKDRLGRLAAAVSAALEARDMRLRERQSQDALRVSNASLQAERDETRRLNQTLEQRVASRTEELQALNLQLEAAAAAKSDFLAAMSHELRTPLTAILGFTEILQDPGTWDTDAPTRWDYLRRIYESSEGLLLLINDVLDMAKVEAGRMELRLTQFSLTAVVRTLIATMAPLSGKAGVVLTYEGPEAGLVTADEDKVRQVLYNLLSNAIKFTPRGGRAWVETARVSGAVQVTVGDTGIGISPEGQALLFQPFRQIASPEAGRPPGTGLGLMLTRRLIELHAGSIRVESAPGQGSRFSFLLPQPLPGYTAPAAPSACDPAAGQR